MVHLLSLSAQETAFAGSDLIPAERTRLGAAGELTANVPAGLYFVTLTDAATGEVLATSAVHHIHGR